MSEQRLYVNQPLAAGVAVPLTAGQAHYLKNVLRFSPGAQVKLFNGRDGEWLAEIAVLDRKAGAVVPGTQTRAQRPEPDLWLLFAPIKGKRNEAIAEKASELGAAVIQPVMTRRTVVSRVNSERLQANALEAAEQCERLTRPIVRQAEKLESLIAAWPAERHLLFADERADAAPIAEAVSAADPAAPWAVLVGPEGGFAPEEQEAIRALPQSLPVSLGPRLLRADTACLAALALWQAHLGDWRHGDRGAV